MTKFLVQLSDYQLVTQNPIQWSSLLTHQLILDVRRCSGRRVLPRVFLERVFTYFSTVCYELSYYWNLLSEQQLFLSLILAAEF